VFGVVVVAAATAAAAAAACVKTVVLYRKGWLRHKTLKRFCRKFQLPE